MQEPTIAYEIQKESKITSYETKGTTLFIAAIVIVTFLAMLVVVSYAAEVHQEIKYMLEYMVDVRETCRGMR